MRTLGCIAIWAATWCAGCNTAPSPEEICASFGLVPDPARGACRCPDGTTRRESGDGCDLPDGGFLPFPDAGVPDAAMLDAGHDAETSCEPGEARECMVSGARGACASGSQSCVDGVWTECGGAVSPTAERCDGVDNDCDDVIDGPSAAASCTAPRVAESACSAGSCIAVDCADSWFDCDDIFDNGCEAQLGTLAHCSECGESCGWDCEAAGCNDAVGVGVGERHACAIRTDRTVVCWGLNTFGGLGDGSLDNSPSPVGTSGLVQANVVAGGGTHTCAIVGGGTVRCWGDNARGQCDNDTESTVRSPHTVIGISDAVSLGLGTQHTCVARASGSVECWGANDAGQLGRGTTTFGRNFRRPVNGLTQAIAVAAGQSHTCAVSRDGSVSCWGANGSSQLGDGTVMERNAPVLVAEVENAVGITAGDRHTCALLDDGTVTCWGNNSAGQLGVGNTSASPSPLPVRDLDRVTHITSGPSSARHTCALRDDGELWCWGANDHGQLGDGSTDTRLVPVRVAADVVAVSAGAVSTCAAHRDGSIRCWGLNDQGQLGDGTLAPRSTPTPVLRP